MKATLFDWVTYYKIAEILAEKNNSLINSEPDLSEASFRVAVSRAYYAAFNKAKRFLRKTLMIKVPRVNTHRFVIDQFLILGSEQSGNNLEHIETLLTELSRSKNIDEYNRILLSLYDKTVNLEYIGFNLENLRDRRNMADYDDIFLFAVVEAQEAVSISQLIIEEIDSLLT